MNRAREQAPQPLLSPLDEHFARAMLRMAAEEDPRVGFAAALVSRQLGHGHVCLDLSHAASIVAEAGGEGAPEVPPLQAWLSALRGSALVGDGEQFTPLVLDEQGKLYLHRYWQYESQLAQTLLARASAAPPAIDGAQLDAGLDRMFGAQPRGASGGAQLGLFDEAPDLQRQAARVALERKLCVITGGPGTGKTSTVARLLALLFEQALTASQVHPRVMLLAPTGKAAARLAEAIERSRDGLPCASEVHDAIAKLEARTIHRAIGVRPGGGFAHDRERPLAADVVIVDEASMVDLALMARLFDAIAPDARVILLGDREQLASVEAGAVLGDICGARLASGPLSPCIVELKRSYRYAQDSGIGALARAVRAGDEAAALDALSGRFDDVAWVQAPLGARQLWPELRGAVHEGFAGCMAPQASVTERLRALDRFRVLCAHRHGPRGLVDLNARIEAELLSAGIAQTHGTFVLGRPLLITQNDYALRLFNGDVGVQVIDPGEGAHRVGFVDAEGAERHFALARLPPCEPVYATSVHKSQGSEMDEVAIVLPNEASPLTSRELLYTAITRARHRATIYASSEVLAQAIRTRVQRASGLRARLWT